MEPSPKLCHIRIIIVSTIFLVFLINSSSSSTFLLSEKSIPQLGVKVRDIMVLTEQKKQSSSSDINVDIQLLWEFVNTREVDLRHDCGKQVFNEILERGGIFVLKSVNCSFQNDKYAEVTLHLKKNIEEDLEDVISYLPLPWKIVALHISPFLSEENTSNEEEEECRIKLRGYEAFNPILVAFNSNHEMLKFPEELSKLIDLDGNTSNKDEEQSVMIMTFDPNAGKGKTFKKTRKCIEILVGKEDKPIDVIENYCVIECTDLVKDKSKDEL